MKIIDTTTFFEEKLMMEIRFNILDEYVDNFIICESTFTHSGQKKKLTSIQMTIHVLRVKLYT